MRDTLTITLVQTQLFWEEKAANLKMLEEKINMIGGKTEIIVLPEMFSTGFTMNTDLAETLPVPLRTGMIQSDGDGPTVAWMRRIAAEKKVILTGSLIVVESNQYYNRLIWMLPNGQYGHYDKRHLFAYADEARHFNAGNKRLIASVKGWKINLQICYDLRFPVWARQAPSLGGRGAAPEYDVLINVANWPERRSLAWKTLLQARAIENQCYVVGVNRVGQDGNGIGYNGDSMVVDPFGEILYHKAGEEDVFTITFQKDRLVEVRNKYPFWKDGDEFQIF